jgi:hypothetical protein
MNDCLQEVGRTGRFLAIVGLALGAAVLAALNIVLVIVAADQKARAEIPGPLMGCALMFGFLSFASAWMLARLLQRSRSANQITMMPVWFIQLFGVFLGAGVVFTALVFDEIFFVVEGLGLALSMIFLPKLLPRSRRTTAPANDYPTADGALEEARSRRCD